MAPQLSPATVRQRESYLLAHILPKFGDALSDSLDVPAMQQFATELHRSVAPKTVINVLGTVFAILRYAKKCRIRTVDVSFRRSDPEISWRKRVGVEPTIRPAKDRIAGFEGRGDHRTPFASASSIEEAARRAQDKGKSVDELNSLVLRVRRAAKPALRLDWCE